MLLQTVNETNMYYKELKSQGISLGRQILFFLLKRYYSISKFFARINLLMDRPMKLVSLSASDRCPILHIHSGLTDSCLKTLQFHLGLYFVVMNILQWNRWFCFCFFFKVSPALISLGNSCFMIVWFREFLRKAKGWSTVFFELSCSSHKCVQLLLILFCKLLSLFFILFIVFLWTPSDS